MEEGPTVRFGAANRQIIVVLHQRPYPDADEPWDRDAIRATVRVQAGAFQGTLATTVWSHELVALGRLFAHLYEHVGTPSHEEFGLLDGALHLTLDLTRIGHLQVHAEAYELDDEVRLNFIIEADQTYLPLWHHDIMKALEHFPPQI